jgi:hypothetical protein
MYIAFIANQERFYFFSALYIDKTKKSAFFKKSMPKGSCEFERE